MSMSNHSNLKQKVTQSIRNASWVFAILCKCSANGNRDKICQMISNFHRCYIAHLCPDRAQSVFPTEQTGQISACKTHMCPEMSTHIEPDKQKHSHQHICMHKRIMHKLDVQGERPETTFAQSKL